MTRNEIETLVGYGLGLGVLAGAMYWFGIGAIVTLLVQIVVVCAVCSIPFIIVALLTGGR